MPPGESLHASCVAVGERGVLILGPSGAGKSRLAFALILAGRGGPLPPTLLVADDRVLLTRSNGALRARAPDALAGLIEIRGLGLRRLRHLPSVELGLVVELGSSDGARLPAAEALETVLHGVVLPRLPIAPGFDPLPPTIGLLLSEPAPL